MPQQLLPLFPLETVLFPRTPLPLHIFEDRYKEMMREILAGDGEFGVVQAGEKGIVNTGCTAVVDKIMRRYDDGRMDLVAVGRRRFEIMELDDERQFLRGAVSFFDDEEFEPVDDQVRLKVLQGYREMVDMSIPQSYQQPTLTDPQLSFQLAQCLPDLTFRQVLLATRSEGERMQQIAAFLDKWLPGQRRTAHVRAVAPLNGHGKAPDSL
ncbi:MAG TPA: LON peptidase substrate-binding domain-containing protein [Bryobacteraceae bacterium]|jgi:Lon protease-like protein|nr:LON peptidase substrate-binding domain-containing protein [Bryobacteraceae bacterium]